MPKRTDKSIKSRREREKIYNLLCSSKGGLRAQEVADRLGIANSTAKYYLFQMYKRDAVSRIKERAASGSFAYRYLCKAGDSLPDDACVPLARPKPKHEQAVPVSMNLLRMKWV